MSATSDWNREAVLAATDLTEAEAAWRDLAMRFDALAERFTDPSQRPFYRTARAHIWNELWAAVRWSAARERDE